MNAVYWERRFVKARGALVPILALTAGVALGYDLGDYATWMQLKPTSGKYMGVVWADPADEAQTAVAPTSGRCYQVPVGKTASSEDVTDVFPGDSLAVAGQVNLNKYGTVHSIKDVRLLPNGVIYQSANNEFAVGPLTVYGTRTAPSTFKTATYLNRNGWKISAPIVGAADAVLRIGNDNSAKERGAKMPFYDGYVSVLGSLADFNGLMQVTSGTFLDFGANVRSFPGTLELSNAVYFESKEKSGTIALGGLTLQSGSELAFLFSSDREVNTSVQYVISEKLTIAEGASVVFWMDAETQVWTGPWLPRAGYVDIIRLTGTAAAAENLPDLSRLRFSPQAELGDLPRNFRCVYVDDANGDKLVRALWDPIDYLVKVNSGAVHDSTSDALYWSLGVVPDASVDTDIWIDETWTPWYYGTLSYPKMTVTLAGHTIYQCAYKAIFKKLNVIFDSSLTLAYAGKAQDHDFATPIEIYGAKLLINGWNGYWHRISGPVSGTGLFQVRQSKEELGVRLTGDLSGFGGMILMSGHDNWAKVDTRQKYYLELGHANVLGGPFVGAEADRWQSVKLSNAWFNVSSDVTAAEPTRGLCLADRVTFDVDEAKTLTLAEDLVVSGQIVKMGPGSLRMASPTVRFGNATLEQPVEGLNALEVREGTLEISHPQGVNGLAVTFAAGTSLMVDLWAAEDLRETGAVNTKCATPFVAAMADGRIPVSFKPTDSLPDEATLLAICTVAATAELAFDIPGKFMRRKVESAWRMNDDGTKTLVARLAARPGICISVR
ncbi:MAG: hypothetical protein MJ240_12540 [Kiritimatiellae bacterium]|nr:hypothetical protein [Kiritimatiellia bacterium]